MSKLHLCLLLQLCVLAVSQRTALDKPPFLQIFRELRQWMRENFGGRNEERSFSAQEGNKVQDEVPANVPFPCNVTGGRSRKVPDSVHRLRPGDIDVIASMGDSLTAGVGIFAKNLLQAQVENRGVSGTIGGEGTWRTYLTLSNILKEFNPNLVGYAYGDSTTRDPESQLNVAEVGAISSDMPFMARYLVNKMKNSPKIDMKRHWKLVTLLIGSNDICSNVCSLPSPWLILENYKINLLKTLRILRDNLPRTFVALILTVDLKALLDAHRESNSLHCYLITQIECGCLFSLQYRAQRPEYLKIIKRWQALEEEIATYPEFHKDDFTIVALPSVKDPFIPLGKNGLTDFSYFSADCFHISQKTNAWYGNIVWNNLLEPVGNKTSVWDVPFKRFLCPTAERPYLITSENSYKRY